MSAALGVGVTQNGPEIRLDFEADIRDEVHGAGTDETNVQYWTSCWSKGMKRDLTREWDGVTDVQLDPEGWWITCRLRPAITLHNALAAFVQTFAARHPSYKHLIVRY